MFPSSQELEKLKFSGQLPNAGNEWLFSSLEMYKANAKHRLHSAIKVTRLPRELPVINVHNYSIKIPTGIIEGGTRQGHLGVIRWTSAEEKASLRENF